jgi:hypothetical protein
MTRKIRILGLVACLFVVWMVTRGTNGCMVAPDAGGVLHVEPDEADTDHEEALVYGSGKLTDKKTNKKHLDNNGEGDFEFQWYTALNGEEITGIITVISKDGRSHTHAEYTVKNGSTLANPDKAKLKKMTQKKP